MIQRYDHVHMHKTAHGWFRFSLLLANTTDLLLREQRHEITKNAGQEKSTSRSNPPKPINISLGTQWNPNGPCFPMVRPMASPRNYSMGKAPGSFPVTYTASPQLKDGAIPAPSWQYWAIMDCKKKLVPWWHVLLDVNGWGDFMRFLCGSCVMC